MSDIRLFRLNERTASEIPGRASDLERPLQNLIEENLEELLGVRFLASEHSTGKTHAGRIDTLGIDEDDCPVILEYKRSVGENVINQGLFYLDWLMDHCAEFELLVLKRLGADVACRIDWSGPRLICIAADFTKYDNHAVQQMGHSIELIRYRRFDQDLLLLELVSASAVRPTVSTGAPRKKAAAGEATLQSERRGSADKSILEWFGGMAPEQRALFESIEGFVLSLGDDVQRKDLKLYIAFKRIRNFVCVGFKKGAVFLWLKLDPMQVVLEPGFSRDVRSIGHWGTGDLEVLIQSHGDLEKAKPLIMRAYER